jgi:hypothetical protein
LQAHAVPIAGQRVSAQHTLTPWFTAGCEQLGPPPGRPSGAVHLHDVPRFSQKIPLHDASALAASVRSTPASWFAASIPPSELDDDDDAPPGRESGARASGPPSAPAMSKSPRMEVHAGKHTKKIAVPTAARNPK